MKKILTAIKLLSLFIFNILIFTSHNPYVLTILLVFCLLLIIPSHLTIKKRLLSILPIIVVILLSQIIFYPSLPLIQRFLFGYVASLKILLISFSVLLFLTYTSLFSLVELFSFLPKDWLLLFLITAYLIPCILKETDEIRIIQKARSPKKNVTGIISLIVPLLHRVFRRSEVLSLAIVARGYNTTI